MPSSRPPAAAVRLRLGAATLGGGALVAMAVIALSTPAAAPAAPNAAGSQAGMLASTTTSPLPASTPAIAFAKPVVKATYFGKG